LQAPVVVTTPACTTELSVDPPLSVLSTQRVWLFRIMIKLNHRHKNLSIFRILQLPVYCMRNNREDSIDYYINIFYEGIVEA
jgi:hypothetical protein